MPRQARKLSGTEGCQEHRHSPAFKTDGCLFRSKINYPELVLEGKNGYFSINYLEMVPLIIRSLQELKQEMDEVKDAEY